MNRQAVYDQVKTHLLTQGKKAIDAIETCVYRSPEGLKCAIGCLIKDEHYTPKLEMLLVSNELVLEALAKSGIEIEDEEDENFLSELQDIHDAEPIASWPRSLRITARTYDITP